MRERKPDYWVIGDVDGGHIEGDPAKVEQARAGGWTTIPLWTEQSIAAHDEQVRAERTLPTEDEVTRALAASHWDRDADDVEVWDALTAEEQENVIENYATRDTARAVLALMADAPTVEQVREEIAQEEVEVEGSIFTRDQLLTVLGNFMRAADQYAREAKAAHIKVEALQAELDAPARLLTLAVEVAAKSATTATDAMNALLAVSDLADRAREDERKRIAGVIRSNKGPLDLRHRGQNLWLECAAGIAESGGGVMSIDIAKARTLVNTGIPARATHQLAMRSALSEALDEIERLRKWKAEALPVMSGLQDLGRALGIRLGTSITGRTATDAALDLRNEFDNVTRVAVIHPTERLVLDTGPGAFDGVALVIQDDERTLKVFERAELDRLMAEGQS